MFLKLFSLGVSVRLNSENSLFEQAVVSLSPVSLNLIHIYTDPAMIWGRKKQNKTQNILVILFQKICSISCKIVEKEDLLELKPHSQRLSGGVSYLGGHNAEAHAIVLLQSYRDNLWLLPHWLKRDRQKRKSD